MAIPQSFAHILRFLPASSLLALKSFQSSARSVHTFAPASYLACIFCHIPSHLANGVTLHASFLAPWCFWGVKPILAQGIKTSSEYQAAFSRFPQRFLVLCIYISSWGFPSIIQSLKTIYQPLPNRTILAQVHLVHKLFSGHSCRQLSSIYTFHRASGNLFTKPTTWRLGLCSAQARNNKLHSVTLLQTPLKQKQ